MDYHTYIASLSPTADYRLNDNGSTLADETTNHGGTWYDYSGHQQQTGLLAGEPTYLSCYFDNASAYPYASAADHTDWDPGTGTASWNMWVKSPLNDHTLYTWWEHRNEGSPSWAGWWIGANGGTVCWIVNETVVLNGISGTTIDDDAVHMVTITYNNGVAKLYVDGSYKGTATKVCSDNAVAMQIGYGPASYTYPNKGYLQYLTYWKGKELSATEVGNLYTYGTTLPVIMSMVSWI